MFQFSASEAAPLLNCVVWDIYGPYMGMIWDNLWAMYGPHVVLIWDITHHIKPVTERSHPRAGTAKSELAAGMV